MARGMTRATAHGMICEAARTLIERPTAFLQALWHGLIGLAYPAHCWGCEEPLASPKGLLCFSCLRAADRADPDDVLERIDEVPGIRGIIDGAFALWMFDKGGSLQRIHRALKFGNRPSYGIQLGIVLGYAFEQSLLHRPPPDLVIPVPLHQTRLYERGYNQSEHLVWGMVSVLEVPFDMKALARRSTTAAQTTLSRSERLQNLQRAFEVTAAERIAGQRILLVDDVLTTGATVGAAAKTLRAAGAEAVDVATLAIART